MASQMDLREAKDPVQGTNALHFASAMGRLEVCRFLVEESGFDVNCTDADGERASLKNLVHLTIYTSVRATVVVCCLSSLMR
jgi:hypothetical protein